MGVSWNDYPQNTDKGGEMDSIEMMRTFVTVARTESFTKGAKELGLAVQTTSKYVKTLEDRLDVQLFDRTTRRVSLNETGKAYFERCVELLADFDDIESSVKSDHDSPRGRIKLSAPTAFGEMHLLPVLAKFQGIYPDISLDLDLSNRKVSLVDEGFDLAIRIGKLDDSNLIAKKLTNMRVSVCVAPSYLEKYGEPKRPEDLLHYNCLIDRNFRYGKNWPFLVDGREKKIAVTGNFKGNSPKSIRQMAVSGLGIGMCPMYVISQDVIAGRLKVLFQQNEAYDFGVFAIYPHRQHLSTRVRVLVDFFASQFRLLQ